MNIAFDRSMRLVAAAGFGISLNITALPAQGDTVTLNPSADNTLFEDGTGSLSGGLGQNFYVGRTGPAGGNAARRGVVRFDVSSIPAGATITSATLRLNLNENGFSISPNVNVHRLLQNWGEGTTVLTGPGGAGAASTAESATWIHTYYNTSFWATAGGHFTNVESVSVTVSAFGNYDFSSATVASDVQTWLDTPSTNFGWLIKTSLEGAGALRFDSRESGTATNRPQLIIGYSYTAPKPAFTGMIQTNGGFNNSWSAITGQVYQMDFITNALEPVTWIPLGTVTAGTTTASMTDTNQGRFRLYRVVHQQF